MRRSYYAYAKNRLKSRKLKSKNLLRKSLGQQTHIIIKIRSSHTKSFNSW